jgi:hypothetical protein
MTAEYVVVYYGLSFPISEEEVMALLNKEHRHQVAARKCGLDCYWGNFSVHIPDHRVFIGKEIGTIGAEYDWNLEFSDSEMMKTVEDAKTRLKNAGFTGESRFLMHFEAGL